MVDFSAIFEKIKKVYQEKKVVFILVTIFVILFFLGLIAFLVQSLNSKKNKTPTIQEAPLVPDQPLLLPEGPSIPDGYALTREPQEKWSKDEGKEYFTVPDKNELDILESTNNKLVDEILGAAP